MFIITEVRLKSAIVRGLICSLFLCAKITLASDADSLISMIYASKDPIQKMELYIQLGDIFEYNNPERAILYYNESYKISNQLRDKSKNKNLLPISEILRAKSLRYLGIVYASQGNYKEALEKYFEAKNVLEDLAGLYTSVSRQEVDLKRAKLLGNIGVVYSHQSLFEIAKEYYTEALVVYNELDDTKSLGVVYNSLGIVEARQANIAEALRYFQQALDKFNLIENKEGIAQTYNNIGNLHLHNGNYEEALKLYNKAHTAYTEMNYLQNIATTLNNIGLVYKELEDYDESINCLKQGLSIRLDINEKKGITDSYNNLGSVYLAMAEFDQASFYFQHSFDISKELGDNNNYALASINMGLVSAKAKNYRDAIRKITFGLELAEQYNLKFVVHKALENLAETYALKGDYKKAFEYSRRHYQVSQEILDEQKSRHISELEIGYQAREKQQKIEILEQERKIDSLKIRQTGTFAFILALLVLVLFIVGVSIMLYFRQRNRILLMKSEKEVLSRLQKTDNDLHAILKSHIYAILLIDPELNVLAFNESAKNWFREYIEQNISNGESLYSVYHPLITELINNQIFHALRGQQGQTDVELFSFQKGKGNFKIFVAPVMDETNQIIQSISLMIEDITERHDTEVKIISDLREKETLIKEIHHRVKNNMQVIISLIRLQSSEIKDVKVKPYFSELEQRVTAMSYVHEELYKSDNLADVAFEDYLKKISANLMSIYNHCVKVNNHISIENDYINIDIAVPCGLIINELLSNSLKYAFDDSNTEISSKTNLIDIFFEETETHYKLRVSDNGKGLGEDFNIENISSMGLHLVKIIVEEQLRGIWSIESNNGVTVSIVFPKGF